MSLKNLTRICALALGMTATLRAQDPREIVRKSVELDQANWLQMKDYTWTAREDDRLLDSEGRIKSEKSEKWETIVLYGEVVHRTLARNSKPLTADQQRKEQEKLDRRTAKLAGETPAQRERRLAKDEKQRLQDREFLREVPDIYDSQLLGSEKVDGHAAWVISATPKPGYKPKRADAKPLLKIQGKIWIDKAQYQWVRLEAQTTGPLWFGLFLVRLDAGAKLIFEQQRVNDEVWLPRREWVQGAARIGLIKKEHAEQELTWSNFRKFQADSKLVTGGE